MSEAGPKQSIVYNTTDIELLKQLELYLPPTFMSVNEAAEKNDYAPSTLREMALNGKLPSIRIGHYWFTTQPAVDYYTTHHSRTHKIKNPK